MKKRHWFKRSSVILSAVVSIAAPTGKSGLPLEGKSPKPCKKSKSPLASLADDTDADTRPPFGDEPPASVDGCCTAPALAAADASKPLRSRPPMERKRSRFPQYPWRLGICTTVFWIGEQPTESNPTPNHASSWDENWAANYGGYDDPDPDARDGFLPAAFKPKQNPFYVALPYNDIGKGGHKEEAEKIVPWFKQEQGTSRYKSTCKGRWIAIRKGDRVCYAQWEDAGPICTTDGGYVFGDARPKSEENNGAGLDVSPAVRDYLGLDCHDSTDWKFVEFEEVPLGPWAEHGENNDFVMNRKRTDGRTVAQEEDRESARGRRRNRSSG
jgi:hypothetical protein